MADVKIRPVRHTDFEDIIRLAQVAFAEEAQLDGLTPEGFTRQLRIMTRGRMIPLKALSVLAGLNWEIFVAESEGKVVGCGGYSGRKELQLLSLMVDPAYRRQGIGQRLTEARLRRIQSKGKPFVTVRILSHNQPSLGNAMKQGFEVFDRYSLLEASLPLQTGSAASDVLCRPIVESDRAAFHALERRLTPPLVLRLIGSSDKFYFPSRAETLIDRYTEFLRWNRAFEVDGQLVGFLVLEAIKDASKGSMLRPLVADEHLPLFPAMLQQASDWLTGLGKEGIQIPVPETRPLVMDQLRASGWQEVASWVRLVKWFTKPESEDGRNGHL